MALLVAIWVATLALSTKTSRPNREKIAGSIAKCERRKIERSVVRRPCCPQCQRPLVQCLCDVLPSQRIPTQHDILILQHPAEFRKKTVSTVPLLRLLLANVHVSVGTAFRVEDLPLLQACLDRGDTPLLLFPGGDNVLSLDDALDRRKLLALRKNSTRADPTAAVPLPTDGHARRPLLLLVDGTWTQAGRMVRDSPAVVAACQHIQGTAETHPSIFGAVRRPPGRAFQSTLEICARALTVLEGDDDDDNNNVRTSYMTQALDRLVRVQLDHNQHGRPRFPGSDRAIRRERRLKIERELFETVSSLEGEEK